MNRRKKIGEKILLLLFCVLFLTVVVRIKCVNSEAEKAMTEIYNMNEWVELGGSYFRSCKENTAGYSIQVTDFKVISKEDYLKKYHLQSDSISEENAFLYITEVTVTIQNENNTDGKLMIADWALIGKNNDFVTYMDPQLLMNTDARIESYISSITTEPGKVISISLPFPMIGMRTQKEVQKNAAYKLAVTKYPMRAYIVLK